MFRRTHAEPKKPQSVGRKRRLRLLASYLPDWLITIILAALFFALDKVPGFKRDFNLSDPSLQHPYTLHERIPNAYLALIAVVAPFVLQGIVNFCTVRSYWDFHCATLGLILALATSGAITQISKITIGRPRPDVISRCQPPQSLLDSPPFGLVTVGICTQTNAAVILDGWRSFPSGHSSLAFAGLGYLSLYLAGKLHLFDQRGFAIKTWIALAPLAGATLVAISRTMDYRHHWHDVVAGSILGLVFAYFSYRQYYPSPASDFSHRPFSPRIGRDEDLPLHQHSSDPTAATSLPAHVKSAPGASMMNGQKAPQREAHFTGREDGEFEAGTGMTDASRRELLTSRQ